MLSFAFLPAFPAPAYKNGKHLVSTQGAKHLLCSWLFIMNEYEEWCKPLFGGSSIWWTENEQKKLLKSNHNRSVGLGGEKVQ